MLPTTLFKKKQNELEPRIDSCAGRIGSIEDVRASRGRKPVLGPCAARASSYMHSAPWNKHTHTSEATPERVLIYAGRLRYCLASSQNLISSLTVETRRARRNFAGAARVLLLLLQLRGKAVSFSWVRRQRRGGAKNFSFRHREGAGKTFQSKPNTIRTETFRTLRREWQLGWWGRRLYTAWRFFFFNLWIFARKQCEYWGAPGPFFFCRGRGSRDTETRKLIRLKITERSDFFCP